MSKFIKSHLLNFAIFFPQYERSVLALIKKRRKVDNESLFKVFAEKFFVDIFLT